MGKVMFSQVCVHWTLGGGYPSPRFFPRSQVPGPFKGVPLSWSMGVPQSQLGVPQHKGTPCPGQDWGTPGKNRTAVAPSQDRTGVPPPARTGVPPLAMTGLGYPQPGQQSEYLLLGGRYASCGHAEGLSCWNKDFCHLWCNYLQNSKY